MKYSLIVILAVALMMSACGSAGNSGSTGSAGTDGAAESEAAVESAAGDGTDEAEAVTGSGDEAEAGVRTDTAADVNEWGLADGIYTVDVETDSNMFHINEADGGTGVLTVVNGEMTVHIRMPSKNIVNLYYGLKEDAQKEGAELIQPTTDEVTYSDGMTDEVYGFDVPVPAIDEPFNVAIIGTHGNWYDHKLTVTNPVAQ